MSGTGPSWVWAPTLNQWYYLTQGIDGRGWHVLQNGARYLADEPRIMPSNVYVPGQPLSGTGGSSEARQSQPNVIQRAYDPSTGVTAAYIIESDGHMRILAGPRNAEPIDPAYKQREDVREFFTFGTVFATLWTEPAGSTRDSYISTVRFNEHVYSQIRRFVVIRESNFYCTAIPITTYGSRGLAKPGVIAHEHALIYTGDSAPALRRSDQGIMVLQVQVNAVPRERLDPLSRLNLGKVYTIEHNVKVKPVGEVTNKEVLREALRRLAANGLYTHLEHPPSTGRSAESAEQTIHRYPRATSNQQAAPRQQPRDRTASSGNADAVSMQQLRNAVMELANQWEAGRITIEAYRAGRARLAEQAALLEGQNRQDQVQALKRDDSEESDDEE